MRNLRPRPRFPLFAAAVIFMTLAVWPTGCAQGEKFLDNQREEKSFNSDDESLKFKRSWKNRNMNLGDSRESLDKPLYDSKRWDDDDDKDVVEDDAQYPTRLESSDSNAFDTAEDINDGDGYGYDDDEYDHINYKRYDNNGKNSQCEKCQQLGRTNPPEQSTIELLSFQAKKINPVEGSQSDKADDKKKVQSSVSSEDVKESEKDAKVENKLDDAKEKSKVDQVAPDKSEELTKTADNKEAVEDKVNTDANSQKDVANAAKLRDKKNLKSDQSEAKVSVESKSENTEGSQAKTVEEHSHVQNVEQLTSNQASLINNKESFDKMNEGGISDEERGEMESPNEYRSQKYVRKKEATNPFMLNSANQGDSGILKDEVKGKNVFEARSRDPFCLNFPLTDLENTDYHRNFIKSLKRLKGAEDGSQIPNQGDTLSSNSDKGRRELAMGVAEEGPRKRKLYLRGLKSPDFSSMRKRKRNESEGRNLLGRGRMHYTNPLMYSERVRSRVNDPGLKRSIFVRDLERMNENSPNLINKWQSNVGYRGDEDGQSMVRYPLKRRAWISDDRSDNRDLPRIIKEYNYYDENPKYKSPLFLVKKNGKDSPSMKTFVDERYKNDGEVDWDGLARLLSTKSNYVVLKKVKGDSLPMDENNQPVGASQPDKEEQVKGKAMQIDSAINDGEQSGNIHKEIHVDKPLKDQQQEVQDSQRAKIQYPNLNEKKEMTMGIDKNLRMNLIRSLSKNADKANLLTKPGRIIAFNQQARVKLNDGSQIVDPCSDKMPKKCNDEKKVDDKTKEEHATEKGLVLNPETKFLKLPEICPKPGDSSRTYYLLGDDKDTNIPKHDIKITVSSLPPQPQNNFNPNNCNPNNFNPNNFNQNNLNPNNCNPNNCTPNNCTPNNCTPNNCNKALPPTKTNLNAKGNNKAYKANEKNEFLVMMKSPAIKRDIGNKADGYKRVAKKESRDYNRRELSEDLNRFIRDFQEYSNFPAGKADHIDDNLRGTSLAELTGQGSKHLQKLNSLLKGIMNNKVEAMNEGNQRNLKRRMYQNNKKRNSRKWMSMIDDNQVDETPGSLAVEEGSKNHRNERNCLQRSEEKSNDSAANFFAEKIKAEEHPRSKRAKRGADMTDINVKVISAVAAKRNEKQKAKRYFTIPKSKLQFSRNKKGLDNRTICEWHKTAGQKAQTVRRRRFASYNEDQDESSIDKEKKKAECIRTSCQSFLDPLVQRIQEHEKLKEQERKSAVDFNESMSNFQNFGDFQNLLETSESSADQKREIVKKDEADWEADYPSGEGNGIAGNREPREDFTLGKRDASRSPKQSTSDAKSEKNQADQKSENDDKMNGAANIRIRIMDGNVGNQMTKAAKNTEDVLKGKGQLEGTENVAKGKASADADGRNSQSEAQEEKHPGSGFPEIYVISDSNSKKRKKKKYAGIKSDEAMQKQLMSSHLPQVDTVYNPSPTSNKAQLSKNDFGEPLMPYESNQKSENILMENSGNANILTKHGKNDPICHSSQEEFDSLNAQGPSGNTYRKPEGDEGAFIRNSKPEIIYKENGNTYDHLTVNKRPFNSKRVYESENDPRRHSEHLSKGNADVEPSQGEDEKYYDEYSEDADSFLDGQTDYGAFDENEKSRLGSSKDYSDDHSADNNPNPGMIQLWKEYTKKYLPSPSHEAEACFEKDQKNKDDIKDHGILTKRFKDRDRLSEKRRNGKLIKRQVGKDPEEIGRRFYYAFKTEVPDEKYHVINRERETADEAAEDKSKEEERKLGNSKESTEQKIQGQSVSSGTSYLDQNNLGKVANQLEKNIHEPKAYQKPETNGFVKDREKVTSKRLASGHLTENHYRKYHRKVVNSKRNAEDQGHFCSGREKRDAFSEALRKDLMQRLREEKKARSMLKDIENDRSGDLSLLEPPGEAAGDCKKDAKVHELESSSKENNSQHPQLKKAPDVFQVFEIQRGRRDQSTHHGARRVRSKEHTILLQEDQPQKYPDEGEKMKNHSDSTAHLASSGSQRHGLSHEAPLLKPQNTFDTPNSFGALASEEQHHVAWNREEKEKVEGLDKGQAVVKAVLVITNRNGKQFDWENSQQRGKVQRRRNVNEESTTADKEIVNDDVRPNRCGASGQTKTSNRKKKNKSTFPFRQYDRILADNSRNGDEDFGSGERILQSILKRVDDSPQMKRVVGPGLQSKTNRGGNSSNSNLQYCQPSSSGSDFVRRVRKLLDKFRRDIEKLAEERTPSDSDSCTQLDRNSKRFLCELLNSNLKDPLILCKTLDKPFSQEAPAEETYPRTTVGKPFLQEAPAEETYLRTTVGKPFLQEAPAEETYPRTTVGKPFLQEAPAEETYLRTTVGKPFLQEAPTEETYLRTTVGKPFLQEAPTEETYMRTTVGKPFLQEAPAEETYLRTTVGKPFLQEAPKEETCLRTTVSPTTECLSTSALSMKRQLRKLMQEFNSLSEPDKKRVEPIGQFLNEQLNLMNEFLFSRNDAEEAVANHMNVTFSTLDQSETASRSEPTTEKTRKGSLKLPFIWSDPENLKLLKSDYKRRNRFEAKPRHYNPRGKGSDELMPLTRNDPFSEESSSEFRSSKPKKSFQMTSGGKPRAELHKLGFGDAAGLQLSLKHHNPWKSNLDLRGPISDEWKPSHVTERSRPEEPSGESPDANEESNDYRDYYEDYRGLRG